MEAGLLGGEKVVWEQGLVRWSSEIVGAHARYACKAGNLRQTTTLSWGGLRAGGNFWGTFWVVPSRHLGCIFHLLGDGVVGRSWEIRARLQ